MTNTGVTLLEAWQSYYVIVGSSAAALTGLVFVVMTLVPQTQMRASREAVDAFSTPIIVHFAATLFVSATISAPWSTLSQPRILIGLTSLAGIVYTLIVIRRTLRQPDYQPVFEDWIWHCCLPLFGYMGFGIGAQLMTRFAVTALFFVAAAAILLLFVGIRNTWDSVTYITLDMLPKNHTGAPGGGA